MNQRTYRLWHHWLAIVGGLFLAIFTLTGVLMLLPKHLPWPSVPPVVQPAPTVDPAAATISPAEAVARAEANAGESLRVQRIVLAPLGPRLAYTLETNRGPIRIDATSGNPAAALTAEEAEAMVRARFGLSGATLERSLEEQASWSYWGEVGLPAWVFSQPEQPSVIYAVGTMDGAMRARTTSMRLNELIGRSHTLWPVALLTGSPRARDLALMVTGVLSLLLIATGFFIILPVPRLRPRRPAQPDQERAGPTP